ncbi:MAG TPA: SulP family inorganic anion transporter [Sulfuricurvum sp.]|nr:MAG: sodium-independent anion transporter [Campylobacterales bacterium 16-40-21]OZA02788.1 MAG: sodium-independent anion transporter [Sulfuricurvum sp. 17-40-25]HQS67469.1 SulP family inorganic anion transporter [Sulfuricurvum sp.]HQT36878.1 SulP family inorganic anion transporter [Sulfuricurvum sp.]
MFQSLKDSLEPKLITLWRLKGYSKSDFYADLIAGLVVAIVALPLAMAIAIASNLPPERGLFTAIVAGFIISAHGGSRYQIGGPTAAFVVTVSMVAMEHGYEGLVLATIMAGVILMIMSFVRAGELIKFIPYPVVIGFTSGIALLIAFSQVRDFFGLKVETIPPDFIDKLILYLAHMDEMNIYAVIISLISIAIIIIFKKYLPKIPGPIVVVVLAGLAVWMFNLPIETIESRFGPIPSMLPAPTWPEISFEKLRLLLPDAITIATLAAIESLLSAVVADGMTGTHHKSNAELFGQGVANIASGIFGGLPATGAIARTATNIKAGARTPMAGIMHAFWLFLFMLFLAPFIIKIPLAALAAILIVVAWNMSEIKHIKEIMKAPRSDRIILIVTFTLTVLIDLNFAIQAGIALASILFINSMMKVTQIRVVENEEEDPDSIARKILPHGVEVYEIQGPLFFGIAEKLINTLTVFEHLPKVFILRMRYVPLIDAAGLHALEIIHERLTKEHTVLILSGVSIEVRAHINEASLNNLIGDENIVKHIDMAISRAFKITNDCKSV